MIKLSPPVFDPDYIISRPRLLEALTADQRWRLMTITAPAGYGKTVLVHQAVQALGQPFVWYQLDSYDNDLIVLVKYLLTGLRRILPGFGEKTVQFLASSGPIQNHHLLVSAIVNDLAGLTGQGIGFVFDDFHHITEPAVHLFFQEFLQYLPLNMRLIISSRHSIPLPLSRLHAAGVVIPVAMADLRFNGAETAGFLARRQTSFTDETIESFVQKSDGWPVALRFFQSGAAVQPFTADNQAIAAYLADEVLNKQPDYIRRFLFGTSVLEYLTPEACDLLLNRNDSAEILAYLLHEQLFITSLAGESRAYRYHHLFRDFLLDGLGQEKAILFKKAAELARQRRQIGNAIEYYQAAGCAAEQIDLIKEAGLQELRNGQWQTVLRWLAAIPTHDIETEPWLAFYQAAALVYQGRMAEAEPLAESAVSGFLAAQDQTGLIESQILKARILNSQGRYQDALEELEQASNLLPPEETAKCFYLPLEKSLCLAKLGRLNQAEAILTEALKSAKQVNNHEITVYLIEGLASVCYLQGEYPKSLQLLRLADQIVPDRVMTGYYIQDSVVGIYNDWGENDRALEHAQRSVATKERFGLTETLPSAYLFLAATYLSQGEINLAQSYFERAADLLEHDGGDRYLSILIKDFLAWSQCLSGHWVEARALMEENVAAAYLIGGLIVPCTLMYQGMVLASSGGCREAVPVLTEAAAGLEQAACRIPLCYTYKALAWSLFEEQEPEAARNIARKYLEIAAKVNLLDGFLLLTHEFLIPIFRHGLETGIEVTYIQRVIVRGGDRFLNLLEELAAAPDPRVRQRVITPLAEIGGATARRILAKMLDDPDAAIRQSACTTADKFGLAERQAELPPPILIQTLGALRVLRGDTEINNTGWPTVKTRDLLAYLVHQQEPVTGDRILEALWPETEPEKAAANFHITLHRLRKILQRVTGKNLILYGAKYYQLLPGEYAATHRRFEHLVTTACAGLNGKNNYSAAESIGLLEEAVALYGGDYLADINYSWIIPAQEYYKQMFYEANLRLARHYLESRDYHRAILNLQKMVEGNPLLEEVHSLLMRAYAGVGDWLGLKRQYQTLETVLQEELGLVPSPETRELYEQLCGRAGAVNGIFLDVEGVR